jgi:hypothetical protein
MEIYQATQETHVFGTSLGCYDLGYVLGVLVDEYGWNADPFNTASGNYRAIKLVMEGLKNTPCNPGFVDARDAILAADQTLYNGVDVCTLWKVFARRGLGYSADEGITIPGRRSKRSF